MGDFSGQPAAVLLQIRRGHRLRGHEECWVGTVARFRLCDLCRSPERASGITEWTPHPWWKVSPREYPFPRAVVYDMTTFQDDWSETLQSTNTAKAEEGRWLPQGVLGGAAVKHHRDGLAVIFHPLWQGHGSCHHVRSGKEEIQGYVSCFLMNNKGSNIFVLFQDSGSFLLRTTMQWTDAFPSIL